MKGYKNGMAVRTLKLLQYIPFIKGWAKRFQKTNGRLWNVWTVR